MSTIQELFKQTQLAEAAYSDFLGWRMGANGVKSLFLTFASQYHATFHLTSYLAYVFQRASFFLG